MPKQLKRLGQVFLHDHNILRKIEESAKIQKNDIIVEIGCGDGILSEALAKTGATLHIIELDPQFLEKTKARLADYENVTFHHEDILKFDFKLLPSPFRIIANIPYYLSTPLLEKIIQNKALIQDSLLMVQKEFADKLVAGPGTKIFGALSLFAQFYCDISFEFRVSKRCFYPVPKVDSAIIQLQCRPEPRYTLDEDKFFTIIKAAFWGRRKTLSSCLQKNPYHPFTKEELEKVPLFRDMPNVRGETLDLDGFYQLYKDLGF